MPMIVVALPGGLTQGCPRPAWPAPHLRPAALEQLGASGRADRALALPAAQPLALAVAQLHLGVPHPLLVQRPRRPRRDGSLPPLGLPLDALGRRPALFFPLRVWGSEGRGRHKVSGPARRAPPRPAPPASALHSPFPRRGRPGRLPAAGRSCHPPSLAPLCRAEHLPRLRCRLQRIRGWCGWHAEAGDGERREEQKARWYGG